MIIMAKHSVGWECLDYRIFWCRFRKPGHASNLSSLFHRISQTEDMISAAADRRGPFGVLASAFSHLVTKESKVFSPLDWNISWRWNLEFAVPLTLPHFENRQVSWP
jgi:hypothetical protein